MNNDNIIVDNTKLRLGATLQMGKYRIVKYLASGGFGNTYLGINNFDEEVAIKEFFMKDINQRVGDSTAVSLSNVTQMPIFKEQMEKFQKEAKRMRKLRNKHIVAVNDLFDENGTTYYVMDYIDGLSLRDMVKQRGKLVEQEVIGYLEQTLDALEMVHGQGIFHLDLKPANLMVDKTGLLRVIDFGASKQQKSDGGATSRSAICYSPGYAPIEQKDQELENFGPWTDLYALGATLYNVLTGNTPPSTSKISDLAEEAFQFPTTVSQDMQQLIIWMMKGRRGNRPQSVKQVRDYLKEHKMLAVFVNSEPNNEEENWGETILNPLVEEAELEPKPKPQPKPEFKSKPELNKKRAGTEKSKGGILKWGLIGFGIVVCIGIGSLLIPGKKEVPPTVPAEEIAALKTLVPDSVKNKAFKNDVLGEYLYTGPIDKNGQPNGIGEATFIKEGQPTGTIYKGPIANGIFNGENAYFYYKDKKNGDNIFEGSFKDNLYEEGKLTLVSDGSYFVGTYKNGQLFNGSWYDKNGKELQKIKNGK